MRTRNVLSAAVFAITTAFLVAPSALAEEEYYEMKIGVEDRHIKPGQDVTVVASCPDPAFRGSKVVSTVLDAGDLRFAPPQYEDGPMVSKGRVKPGTKPGTYLLFFVCDGKRVSGAFEVEAAKTSPAKLKAAANKPAEQAKGAADTGGGDNVVQATEPQPEVAPNPVKDESPNLVAAAGDSTDSNTGALALGGAGLVVLGGAAALGYRRFRRQS